MVAIGYDVAYSEADGGDSGTTRCGRRTQARGGRGITEAAGTIAVMIVVARQ
jgi:hypothetical protein